MVFILILLESASVSRVKKHTAVGIAKCMETRIQSSINPGKTSPIGNGGGKTRRLASQYEGDRIRVSHRVIWACLYMEIN